MTNKQQHTPGPWHITETHHHQTFIYGPSDEPVLVDVNRRVPTSAANARLIAAAPDLLDAMTTVERWFLKHSPTAPCIDGIDRIHPMLEMAQKAIAKARGEDSSQGSDH